MRDKGIWKRQKLNRKKWKWIFHKKLPKKFHGWKFHVWSCVRPKLPMKTSGAKKSWRGEVFMYHFHSWTFEISMHEIFMPWFFRAWIFLYGQGSSGKVQRSCEKLCNHRKDSLSIAKMRPISDLRKPLRNGSHEITSIIYYTNLVAPLPGGGALRYRVGPHPRYVFRGRRGLF